MAIAVEDYEGIQNIYSPVSESITVPANTDFAILFIGAYKGSTSWLDIEDFDIDGDNFTMIESTFTQTGNEQCALGYIKNPSTGSQTLSGTFTGSPSTEGNQYVLLYLSGVNLSSPIIGSDKDEDGYWVSGMGTESGCLMVGVGASYYKGGTPSAHQYGQTAIWEENFNDNQTGVGYEFDDDAFHYVGDEYDTVCACVLREAGAGPSGSPWYAFAQQ